MARYIDAEQACSKIAEVAEIYAFCWDEDEYEMGYNHALTFALNELKKAQVADVKPVVHAHWVETEYGVHCSNCKDKALWDDCGGEWLTDYCPTCGAKMDGVIHAHKVKKEGGQ